MRKTRRNDPCPCGSGKKYKRCCGANTNTHSNVHTMNDTLYRIHQNLIAFATNNYDTKLQDQLTSLENPSIEEEEMRTIFHTGLTPWIVATVPCLDNKDTIFDRYYRKIQAQLNPLAKSILVKWPRTIPSVYEIVSIDSPKRNYLQVRELRTQETFNVPYDRDQSNFTEDGLLIGMMVPFVQHDNFLFSMVTLYDRDTQFYRNLLETYSNKDGGIGNNYPAFLADALHHSMSELQWDNPLYEEVIELFVTHMENKKVNGKAIVNGMTTWNEFCQRENPTIQKPEPYAAALDYYIQREVLQKTDVRQAQVADEYDTSPSTLSRIYRNIIKVVTE